SGFSGQRVSDRRVCRSCNTSSEISILNGVMSFALWVKHYKDMPYAHRIRWMDFGRNGTFFGYVSKLTVFGWRRSGLFFKRSYKVRLIFKPQPVGDFFDRHGGLFQKASGLQK